MACTPPAFGTYIEPFAGSACLFFALLPKRSILGDFNAELIEAYSVVAQAPDRVHDVLVGMADTASEYYRVRSWKPAELSAVYRTARFIYLNRFCFNGVYRTNLKGEFNVPRGRDTGELPSLANLREYALVLSQTELQAGDFLQTLGQARKGDFVYLDPPYTKQNQPYSGEYGYGAFSANDMDRLLPELDRIDALGATFLFSYRYTPVLHQQLRRWNRRLVSVRRHVAGFSSARRIVREMLVSNRDFDRLPQ